MTSAFAERCAELHLPYDERFFWYHTIDLGDGLVTPGSFDYRGHLDSYAFAPELHGRSALDLGSATGFFTFELERRGANVTSIELPSLFSWDHFPGEPPLLISGKMQRLLPNHVPQAEETLSRFFTSHSPAEQYHYLLDGPFRFCHRVLRSRAQRVYATAYDLPHALAPQRFDLVFAGDILAHLIDPLRAVAAMAEICDGTLIIAQALSTEPVVPRLRTSGVIAKVTTTQSGGGQICPGFSRCCVSSGFAQWIR